MNPDSFVIHSWFDGLIYSWLRKVLHKREDSYEMAALLNVHVGF